MKFLIQQNLIFDKSLAKVEAATRDYPRDFVSIIPFSEEIISNDYIDGDNYIPYGSTRLIELAYQRKWKGLHFNENFNCKETSRHRSDMLNCYAPRGCYGSNVFYIKEAIQWLRSDQDSLEDRWFLRPNNDLKLFSGEVMTAREAANFLEDALLCESSGTYKLNEDTEIVIAAPVKIDMEWRYFIIDGKIISGSVYMSHGQLIPQKENDPEVLKEAQGFADKWLPDDCVVMDLALVHGKLWLLEFNCINGSGFYDHDIDLIFKEWYTYHNVKI